MLTLFQKFITCCCGFSKFHHVITSLIVWIKVIIILGKFDTLLLSRFKTLNSITICHTSNFYRNIKPRPTRKSHTLTVRVGLVTRVRRHRRNKIQISIYDFLTIQFYLGIKRKAGSCGIKTLAISKSPLRMFRRYIPFNFSIW